MNQKNTITIEDELLLSFCKRPPLVIERGNGVRVWDENGREYLDFTSGWAVTSLGHCHQVIIDALTAQCKKIMHNPNSGLTYAPTRAQLLTVLKTILPAHYGKLFFSNSGAEANDAAIKLARKITGKKKIISMVKSFHGRTIGTVSATGQAVQKDRFNVLVPHFAFVPYGNVPAVEAVIDSDTAGIIVEPLQGEGGVVVPEVNFLEQIDALCKKHRILLIVDEIQTGFFRTGPAFMSKGVRADFLTMAKGIAGGFPFGAVAVSEEISGKLEEGDHGGTYNGNPLGCAVAKAVVTYMIESNIEGHVRAMGEVLSRTLLQWKGWYPGIISNVRGLGLLQAIEFYDPSIAESVVKQALEYGLIVNLKHGTILRIFPALNIPEQELLDGLAIIRTALENSI